MAGTRNVNPSHIITAKPKIAARKTSANQQTAPPEVEKTPLECNENWDEVEIPSYNTQEGKVENPPEIKNADEQLPPQVESGWELVPPAKEEHGKPKNIKTKKIKKTVLKPYYGICMF